MYRKKRSNFKLILFLTLIVGLFGTMFYLKNDPRFEQIKPKIEMADTIYWNPSRALEIDISDNGGLRNIEAFLEDGDNEVELADIKLLNDEKKYKLKIDFPKMGILARENLLKLTIIVRDSSLWGFFRGNKVVQKSIIYIDKIKPDLLLINNSYSIGKGGTALVIFRAKDKNLKNTYITTNYGKKFYTNEFYKKGYYISLVAWPIFEKTFTAWIVAEDYAGNKTKQRVAFYLKYRNYRVSHIKASDRFINGKITQLAEDRPEKTKDLTPVQKMKFINEDYRIENEDLIRKYATKVDDGKISEFNLNRFYPLKNGQRVGSYGDHRYYYYKTKENVISESYHMGLDLASVRQADIKTSNKAICVYAKYNGIYGNNVILYHGLGLYTLYGHCSSFLVGRGDIAKKGEAIARTGATGLALGDHLHFGISVQGIFVRPAEWMDSKWMKTNITKVINKAKNIIGK